MARQNRTRGYELIHHLHSMLMINDNEVSHIESGTRGWQDFSDFLISGDVSDEVVVCDLEKCNFQGIMDHAHTYNGQFDMTQQKNISLHWTLSKMHMMCVSVCLCSEKGSWSIPILAFSYKMLFYCLRYDLMASVYLELTAKNKLYITFKRKGCRRHKSETNYSLNRLLYRRVYAELTAVPLSVSGCCRGSFHTGRSAHVRESAAGTTRWIQRPDRKVNM